jgi:biotin carboxyl carrier protein
MLLGRVKLAVLLLLGPLAVAGAGAGVLYAQGRPDTPAATPAEVSPRPKVEDDHTRITDLERRVAELERKIEGTLSTQRGGGVFDGYRMVTGPGRMSVDMRDTSRRVGSAETPSVSVAAPVVFTNAVRLVRARFQARVQKVFVKGAQAIKKGQPLAELYSTEKASAWNDWQSKWVEWEHHRKLLTLRRELVKTGAISQQVWVDTQNDEQKSRLDEMVARDKLETFYEIPGVEIVPLSDNKLKAEFTVRSPVDGVVLAADAVLDNYYEPKDILFQISTKAP